MRNVRWSRILLTVMLVLGMLVSSVPGTVRGQTPSGDGRTLLNVIEPDFLQAKIEAATSPEFTKPLITISDVVTATSSVTTVIARVISDTAIRGRPGMDEGVTRNRIPEGFDPKNYMPIPLPAPNDMVSTQPISRTVSYDIATGVETVSEKTYGEMPINLWSGNGRGIAPESETSSGVYPNNFADLALISNPQDWPWVANVKVFFSKPSGRYMCSGTMIDSLHVLTAGHCVHDRDDGGWVTNVEVIPGYQRGSGPFGNATAIQLHSWAGWTDAEDYNHDIGVIDLDRPIGALSGWYGYGYNNDCSFFMDNTFHNPGYPGESPYDGELMYYWYGDFDGCQTALGIWYGNQVWFNKYSYGGQSGSGAHHINDSNSRAVYAVLSNGDSSSTNDVRITSEKFGHIGDFVSDDTPSTFDLIPLFVQTSDGANPGGHLSSMSYT